LHSEKILDDWLVPVASPDLIKQYGMIERGANLSKYPLLESGDEPWSVWSQTDEETAWHSRSPSIEDSAGLLAAAEESLGFALARWTLVSRALHKGTLRLAGKGALPYGSAYYFVCPKNFLAIPKVAQFREWLMAAAREFPGPSAPDTR
jgi:LysR family glycine cleavage system transcriptional activator